jgi:hypothetical protein
LAAKGVPAFFSLCLWGEIVHNAIFGGWAEESPLTAEHLNSVRGLNHRFLDLAGARTEEWAAAGHGLAVGARLRPLSRAQRAAAADCPYALFDLRFEDEAHWRGRLAGDLKRIADEPGVDEETGDFVRLALFYSWHVASSNPLAAQVLFGMRGETSGAFRRIPLDALPGLAATEAANLTARWSDCDAYWTALIGAAARADPKALRRVQLSGLQIAAAAQLPSEPREV